MGWPEKMHGWPGGPLWIFAEGVGGSAASDCLPIRSESGPLVSSPSGFLEGVGLPCPSPPSCSLWGSPLTGWVANKKKKNVRDQAELRSRTLTSRF